MMKTAANDTSLKLIIIILRSCTSYTWSFLTEKTRLISAKNLWVVRTIRKTHTNKHFEAAARQSANIRKRPQVNRVQSRSMVEGIHKCELRTKAKYDFEDLKLIKNSVFGKMLGSTQVQSITTGIN